MAGWPPKGMKMPAGGLPARPTGAYGHPAAAAVSVWWPPTRNPPPAAPEPPFPLPISGSFLDWKMLVWASPSLGQPESGPARVDNRRGFVAGLTFVHPGKGVQRGGGMQLSTRVSGVASVARFVLWVASSPTIRNPRDTTLRPGADCLT